MVKYNCLSFILSYSLFQQIHLENFVYPQLPGQNTASDGSIQWVSYSFEFKYITTGQRMDIRDGHTTLL